MRNTTTICISLPRYTVEQLRQDAETLGMTLSGYMKIVATAGMKSPLVDMLKQTRKEVDTDGPEV